MHNTFQAFGPILTQLSTTTCAIYCFIRSKAFCCSGPTQVWFPSWWLGTVTVNWLYLVCIFTKILPFKKKICFLLHYQWNHCNNLISHVSMKTERPHRYLTHRNCISSPASPSTSFLFDCKSHIQLNFSYPCHPPLGQCFPKLWCHQHTPGDLGHCTPPNYLHKSVTDAGTMLPSPG